MVRFNVKLVWGVGNLIVWLGDARNGHTKLSTGNLSVRLGNTLFRVCIIQNYWESESRLALAILNLELAILNQVLGI